MRCGRDREIKCASHTLSAQHTLVPTPADTQPVPIAPYPTDPCLMGTQKMCQLRTWRQFCFGRSTKEELPGAEVHREASLGNRE
jgi:hypothetical protein